MMKRRDFLALAGAVAAFPRVGRAQQAPPARAARVGVLVSGSSQAELASFFSTLRALGYVEGQNISFDIRVADQVAERMPALARELVDLKPDVIVAGATQAAHAAKEVTTQIPLVLHGGDLLATGIFSNLTRPGGNATGFNGQGANLGGKMVVLARDFVPGMQRMAILLNEDDPFAKPFAEGSQTAADQSGVRLQAIWGRGSAPNDQAFAAMIAERAEAVVIQGSMASEHSVQLALANRLPSFSNSGSFAARGGLVQLRGSIDERNRILAQAVDLILGGTKAGDIPVQEASAFDVILNRKTARTLAVTIPPAVLIQVTEFVD